MLIGNNTKYLSGAKYFIIYWNKRNRIAATPLTANSFTTQLFAMQ